VTLSSLLIGTLQLLAETCLDAEILAQPLVMISAMKQTETDNFFT
jgi:hypothetical protein